MSDTNCFWVSGCIINVSLLSLMTMWRRQMHIAEKAVVGGGGRSNRDPLLCGQSGHYGVLIFNNKICNIFKM